MMFRPYLILLLPFLSMGGVIHSHGETTPFWSAQTSPELIGDLVIEDLLSRPDYMMYVTDDFTGIHYAEAAMGYGALRLADRLDAQELIKRLEQRYRTLPGTDGLLAVGHVDANVYGILPLQLYLTGKNDRKRDEGLRLADAQWEDPLPGGMTKQTRYWIDDVWMVGVLQVQAFRTTGNKIYLDRAALEIDAYLKKLQRSNGLFHHGENAPFFWGRGNGWVAAGLAELLSELPTAHPHYSAILTGYKKMMDALLKYQADDGMWRQLLDRESAWKETSSTAMFGYAISSGVAAGILDEKKFRPAYQKAWLALTRYIDERGRLSDVCIGTGQSKDINYYLERPKTTGDFHGQAPVLWFADKLLAMNGK